MLKSLQIKHFKAWKDTGKIRLAPLTVIFGANSAGKSSLGHLLLALKQTAISSDRRRALHLGDQNTLIDLGTFADCLHAHDLDQSLEFDIGWKLSKELEIRNPSSRTKRYRGSELSLKVKLKASKAGQPEATLISYELGDGQDVSLNAEFSRDAKGAYALRSDHYTFTKTVGRSWPLGEPEKFYRISDTSRARFQNAGFLADFALATEQMLGGLYYLGPLRDHPRRTYQWSGDTPEDVGQRGEFTVPAILAAESQARKLNRGFKEKLHSFTEFIAGWLKDLGVIHSFDVRPVAEGRKEYEVLIKTGAKSPEVKITDVGFGVSQVLPALVLPFYCPANSVIWMEQPEIHLHPQVQAELADVFICAVQARERNAPRNVQLIVESHSEHFLNRLQRRVAEREIQSEEVAIYFCKRTESGTELEPLKLNELGDIENWPENFFGNEMEDLTARTVAAASRRKELAREMTVIIDTNVILVANGQHQDVSPDCVADCALRLQSVMADDRIALDKDFEILTEYQNKTKPKTGNRPGDAFVKWALRNNANLKHCDLVLLQRHSRRRYESFPDDDRLANFDPQDRKFVAVAAAHDEHPPILQATDSKWLDWKFALADLGITVEFVCPKDIQRFRTNKFGK